MADVSHELGALRFVVDSPLSSKVAMFNNAATKHQESQHLNPFSQSGGLPKPTFNKGEYGKPLAGSLTEMRGQKANIHVLKEMLELCQIIDSEGYNVKDEPSMKVIPFGELFNIYTYISDKVVGILLRARKHKLVEFEGEVLFQHRDEDVPVFLLKPIKEIRQILEQKQDEIRRSVSPAPQATSVILDHKKRSVSASPTPSKQKSVDHSKPKIVKPIAQKPVAAPVNTDQKPPEIKVEEAPKVVITEPTVEAVSKPMAPATAPTTNAVIEKTPETSTLAATSEQKTIEAKVEPTANATEAVDLKPATPSGESPDPKKQVPPTEITIPAPEQVPSTPAEVATGKAEPVPEPTSVEATSPIQSVPQTVVTPPTPTAESAPTVLPTPTVYESTSIIVEEKIDINNNEEEAPAIVDAVAPSSDMSTVPNVA